MMREVITDDGSITFYNDQYDECYHSRSGAYEEAVKKQFFIIDLRDLMYSVPNIPAAYAVLKMRGIDVGYPKQPYKQLSEDEVKALRAKLEERGLL